MSRRLHLSSQDLHDLGRFIEEISLASQKWGFTLEGWPLHVNVGETQLALHWDEQASEYVIEDEVGG